MSSSSSSSSSSSPNNDTASMSKEAAEDDTTATAIKVESSSSATAPAPAATATATANVIPGITTSARTSASNLATATVDAKPGARESSQSKAKENETETQKQEAEAKADFHDDHSENPSSNAVAATTREDPDNNDDRNRALAVRDDQKSKMKQHHHHHRQQHASEEEEQEEEEMPTHYSLNTYDVLCGRGNGVNNRQGNIEFRNYVEQQRAAYANAERNDKVRIAQHVVDSVRQKGGKFVKFKHDPTQEVYLEISYERAVEKACQALREISSAVKKKSSVTARTNTNTNTSRSRSGSGGGGGGETGGIQRKLSTESASAGIDRANAEKEVERDNDQKTTTNPSIPNMASDTTQKHSSMDMRPKVDSSKHLASTMHRPVMPSAAVALSVQQQSQTSKLPLPKDPNPKQNANRGSTQPPNTQQQQPQQTTTNKRSLPTATKNTNTRKKNSNTSASAAAAAVKKRKSNPTTKAAAANNSNSNSSNNASNNNSSESASLWFCDRMVNGVGNLGSSNVGYNKVESSQNFDTMYRALMRFKKANGHCAVPPSANTMGQEWKWTREGKEAQQLCDWASLQRQLYRETFNGCRRKAKESEKARFERLERQGFVWNYEEWHWDRMYLEVMAYQKAEQIRQQQQQVNTTMNENDNDDNARIITMAADAAVDSEDLSVSAEFPYLKCFRMALWIKEQHDLVLEGLRGNMQPMRNTRVQKLGKIDFSFFTNAFLLDYAGKEMEELTLTASPAAPVKEEEEQESPTQVDSARGRVKEDLDAFDKLCFIEQRAREIAFEEAMKKLES